MLNLTFWKHCPLSILVQISDSYCNFRVWAFAKTWPYPRERGPKLTELYNFNKNKNFINYVHKYEIFGPITLSGTGAG